MATIISPAVEPSIPVSANVALATGPIFVVGYIHTGTSLLKTILRKDPTLFAAAGETHFFQDLPKLRAQFPDLNRDNMLREYILFLIKLVYLGFKRAHQRHQEYTLDDFGLTEAQLETLLTAAHQKRQYAPLFGLVMDYLTQLNEKLRWLEKTPEHVNYLKQILQLHPDARVIELVRDPRATLASRKIRRGDDDWLDDKETREGASADHSTNYDPLLDTLLWKEAINAAADARREFPANILTVRYEDLAADPEATLRHICRFAGLPFRPDMLTVGWVNSATQSQEGKAASQSLKGTTSASGISTAAIEKWRKSLSPEEIYLCQWLGRKEMEQLEYLPAAVSLAARVKAPALLGHSALHLYSRARGRRPAQFALRARDTSQRMVQRTLKNLGLQKGKS
jgi:hypothetical protein